MNPTLFSLQDPVTLPSLTIFLAPGSSTQLDFPNGVYIGGAGGPVEILYMGAHRQFASLSAPGTHVCLTTVQGLAQSITGQWLNPSILFPQDGAAYGWGDGRPSKVKLIPAGQAPALNTLPPLACPYAEIVIPSGELLLFNGLTEPTPTMFMIAPAEWAKAHYEIHSIGG